MAAELHPDVAVAYEAAQDRAAAQMTGWVGRERDRPGRAAGRAGRRRRWSWSRQSTCGITRPGPATRTATYIYRSIPGYGRRGNGAPWTRSRSAIVNAINGIGHAAVACDPDFRAALAAHGYTFNPDGEIEQLAQFVEPFSRRAAQIGVKSTGTNPTGVASARARCRGRRSGAPGTRRPGHRSGPTRLYPNPARTCTAAGSPSWPHSDTETATGRCSSRCRWLDRSTATPR